MYFNYHAKAKRLISDGHCVGFQLTKCYHKISPCLLLFFDDKSVMPIRKPHFEEYFFLLAKYGIEEKKL